MNRRIQSILVPCLSLGFVSGFSLAAAAQEVVEDWVAVEEVAPDPEAIMTYREGVIERRVIEDPAIDDEDEEDVIAAGEPLDMAVARCAAQFRSFDPATGTYVSYAGEVLPCPYLP